MRSGQDLNQGRLDRKPIHNHRAEENSLKRSC